MQFIETLREGEPLSSVYVLKQKELLKTKEGKPYLRIVLADKTGTIEARMWDRALEADQKVELGGAVFVGGTVVSYRDSIQIKVDTIRPAAEGEYEKSDLFRSVADIDAVFHRVMEYLESIRNPWIGKLTARILADDSFVSRLKKAPGAKSWHNAYTGGLLEHTGEVMYIVDAVCALYPQVDRDIALAGAFMHDLGKVWELDPDNFEYTIEGGLIGHLPLGFAILSQTIQQIEGFPADLSLALRHIVLSHHGEYEQQSPILPKTLEATIVYHADELASQASAVSDMTRPEPHRLREWSNFVSIKNRRYLLRKDPSEAEKKKGKGS